MTTYYYPSTYGGAEFNPNATAAGTSTFTSNYQSPAGSYTVVTALPNTSPQQYTITTDYTGPGTGTTFTVTQTPYSNANHNETYGVVPGFGPAYFLLTNGQVPANYSYTFTGQSAPFQPTGGATTDPTLCFVSGTRIRTANGDVEIERLSVGDMIATVDGARRPIRWIGHRTLSGADKVLESHRWPVRVVAHAFGQGLPERDLYVSPGHPVLVGADESGLGGHLVPIMCLINGTTITRAPRETVTYWHIELDQHDIVLAEGLPVESYIDFGTRAWFDGSNDVLHDPDVVLAGCPGRCRPVEIEGPVVEAERRRLDAMFATRLRDACVWPQDGMSATA